MNIRPALIKDYKALLSVDSIAPHDKRRASQIAEWINKQSCYLVELDNEVAAYGVLNYHFFHHGYIEMLMVKSEHRRNQLGLALVEHFKSICKDPKLFTTTNLSNEPMQLLLQKCGFSHSGQIDNLDDGDPELVFFWANTRDNEANLSK